MPFLHNLKSRLGLFKELTSFFWQERLWWLIPFLLVLGLVGFLLLASQNPFVAPFIYTLF